MLRTGSKRRERERVVYKYYIIIRSQGRIVEALVNDFVALVGSGVLTVVVQNTGAVTADYSVSTSSLQ